MHPRGGAGRLAVGGAVPAQVGAAMGGDQLGARGGPTRPEEPEPGTVRALVAVFTIGSGDLGPGWGACRKRRRIPRSQPTQ